MHEQSSTQRGVSRCTDHELIVRVTTPTRGRHCVSTHPRWREYRDDAAHAEPTPCPRLRSSPNLRMWSSINPCSAVFCARAGPDALCVRHGAMRRAERAAAPSCQSQPRCRAPHAYEPVVRSCALRLAHGTALKGVPTPARSDEVPRPLVACDLCSSPARRHDIPSGQRVRRIVRGARPRSRA